MPLPTQGVIAHNIGAEYVRPKFGIFDYATLRYSIAGLEQLLVMAWCMTAAASLLAGGSSRSLSGRWRPKSAW
jgi:hypothetical protein